MLFTVPFFDFDCTSLRATQLHMIFFCCSTTFGLPSHRCVSPLFAFLSKSEFDCLFSLMSSYQSHPAPPQNKEKNG